MTYDATPEMEDRARQCAAVLVAGHGTLETSDALLHTLGQIGEALLATSSRWQVRRLSPVDGEWNAPDRAGLKRQIADLADQSVNVILLVIVGYVFEHDGEPALVSGADYRENPADSTLPLRWICERLRSCVADRVVVVMSATSARSPSVTRVDPRWMDALGTARPRHLVAIDAAWPRAVASEQHRARPPSSAS